MHTLYIVIGAALFGALWRFVDGLDRSQSRIPAAIRGVIFFAAALVVCKLTGKTWLLAAFMASAATLNIIVGHTKWDDWTWQACRFSMFAAWTVLPLNDFAHTWPYVFLCAVAGLSYPVLFLVDGQGLHLDAPKRLPRWRLLDGPEAYARLPLGAAILGGLALV